MPLVAGSLRAPRAPAAAGEGPSRAALCSLAAREGPRASAAPLPWWPAASAPPARRRWLAVPRPWWPAASARPVRRQRPGKKVPRTGSPAPLVVLRAGGGRRPPRRPRAAGSRGRPPRRQPPSRRPCAWRPALAGTRAFHGRIEAESGEGREEGGRKKRRGRGGDGRWWIRLVGRGSEEIKSGRIVGGG